MIREEILESPHSAIASILNNLAVVLRSKGSFDEAVYFFERALEQERKLHGDDHPRVTTAMSNLSQIHLDLARYDEAATQYLQVLEKNRRQLGPSHIYVGFALGYLSIALIEDGRSTEAMHLIEEMLDVFRNAVGQEHRFYTKGLMIKGYALYYEDPGQASVWLDRSVEKFRRIVGPEHPDLADALCRLGWSRIATGQMVTAEAAFREALEIQRKVHPDPHSDTIWTMTGLGRVLIRQGQHELAEQLLREAVDMSANALPAGHWRSIAARLELADCLMAAEKITSARGELERVLGLLQDRTDFHAIRILTHAYEIQGRLPG